ncbi:MAG TPA: sigma-70 family RNA polymerase sigma factor [Bryobacteraceae bacterium]|nr:sigma-70 family RNA polymerase sigma factor [Bryobacteraceae bacterium]
MGSPQSGEITGLLRAWAAGEPSALDRLFPDVYEELRQIAETRLRSRHAGDTVEPATLVHEAYLRFSQSDPVQWNDRSHFFAVAATFMRHILLDHARARKAAKRGGGIELTLSEPAQPSGALEAELLDVDIAIQELARLDQQQAKIVELRFFGGLSIAETAEALGISPATVKRDWAVAKTWIRRRLAHH